MMNPIAGKLMTALRLSNSVKLQKIWKQLKTEQLNRQHKVTK